MTERLRIYVAGPYTAETDDGKLRNTVRAIDAGIDLLAKGHFPFIPHLTHYVDRRADELDVDLAWEDYVEWDVAFLECCDAFLHLASSPGADIEREHAREHGLRVFESTASVPIADVDESDRFQWRETAR